MKKKVTLNCTELDKQVDSYRPAVYIIVIQYFSLQFGAYTVY